MMKEVQNNPGKAIKKYALICSKLIIIIGIIYAVIYFSTIYKQLIIYKGYTVPSYLISSLIPIGIISVSVYLSAYLIGVVLYGFGDLVEKTAEIKEKMDSPKTMKLTAGTREATIRITNQQD